MKKLYFVFLSIFFFIIYTKPIYALDNLDCKKLTKNIYIDNKSIVTQDGAKIAWFIEYSQDKYEKTRIKAYCDVKVLEILEFATLDKNRNLISFLLGYTSLTQPTRLKILSS